MVRYDDANAAAVEQDYVDGTHVGTITVTIDGGGSGATGTADVYLLTCEPQRPIGGINALRITAASLDASNFTWVLPSGS
jgi:hypothetical protein